MADYPVCEFCGHSNWPKQAWMHVNCGEWVFLLVSTSKHGVYADKAKRVEYMRKYMAKKRAALTQ